MGTGSQCWKCTPVHRHWLTCASVGLASRLASCPAWRFTSRFAFGLARLFDSVPAANPRSFAAVTCKEAWHGKRRKPERRQTNCRQHLVPGAARSTNSQRVRVHAACGQ